MDRLFPGVSESHVLDILQQWLKRRDMTLSPEEEQILRLPEKAKRRLVRHCILAAAVVAFLSRWKPSLKRRRLFMAVVCASVLYSGYCAIRAPSDTVRCLLNRGTESRVALQVYTLLRHPSVSQYHAIFRRRYRLRSLVHFARAEAQIQQAAQQQRFTRPPTPVIVKQVHQKSHSPNTVSKITRAAFSSNVAEDDLLRRSLANSFAAAAHADSDHD
ncbi:MAG: hypothetical protein MHM6MM_001558 [Cercozoa sp. M6MM]